MASYSFFIYHHIDMITSLSSLTMSIILQYKYMILVRQGELMKNLYGIADINTFSPRQIYGTFKSFFFCVYNVCFTQF